MRLIDAHKLTDHLQMVQKRDGLLGAIDRVVMEVIDRFVREEPTVDAAPRWHRVEEPPKWVSVFDDLPRNNAVVVVSDGKRSWDVGQYHFLFKADDRTIWWWKKHTTRKVLWWMYKEDAIPEPPKEDA